MSNFVSYHWNINDVGAELKTAVQKLVSGKQTPDERAKIFLLLLDSDDDVAQGIVFDQFFYTDSLYRFGVDNAFEQFNELLLEKARKQLQSPPVGSTTSDGRKIIGANHASALYVIARLGEEKDIPLITSILESSKDIEVIYSSCLAFQRCLGKTSKVWHEAITALAQIIYDEKIPAQLRTTAVRAFAEYKIAEAEKLLREISQECDASVSVYAAYTLAGLDFEHNREFLRQLSDSWEDDIGYPAGEILEMLDEDSAYSESEE